MCKSELRYSNPFRNASVFNDDNLANFGPKSVAMAVSLEKSEKKVRIEKIHANSFYPVKQIVKISPVYRSWDNLAQVEQK